MAGTITITEDKTGTVKTVTATCVADAANGSFPTLVIPAIVGRLLAIQTNPGSPAPTDNYDITLVDQDGIDKLNGAGQNRDTVNSERLGVPRAPAIAHGDALTLAIVNNSVNSAQLVISLYYADDGDPIDTFNTVNPVTTDLTVGTGAGVLVPTNALPGRKVLALLAAVGNTGTIFIGDSPVTTTTHFIARLSPGDGWADDIGSGALYATSDTAGQTLRVYER